MKREIKFRAKRTDGLGWAYGYLVHTPITAEFNAISGNFFDSASAENTEWAGRWCIVQSMVAHEIDIDTLGQWTGLKDKAGKDIYVSQKELEKALNEGNDQLQGTKDLGRAQRMVVESGGVDRKDIKFDAQHPPEKSRRPCGSGGSRKSGDGRTDRG